MGNYCEEKPCVDHNTEQCESFTAFMNRTFTCKLGFEGDMCEVESAADYTFFYYAVFGSAVLIASVFGIMTMASNVKTAEMKKKQRIQDVQNIASRKNKNSSDLRKRKRKNRPRKEGSKKV